MEHKDFKARLSEIIKDEVNRVLQEAAYTNGGLLNPQDFDPNDPEIHIIGYGSMARSQIRNQIAKRLEGLSETAKSAIASEDSYRKYKSILDLISTNSVLLRFIMAEIEVSEQLEAMRRKGGRRAQPIPRQF